MTKLQVTFSTVTIPTGVTVDLTVYEDSTGDGNADNQASTTLTDGQTSYTLSGFDATSGNDIWPRLEPRTSDISTTTSLAEATDISLAVANETGSVTVTSNVSGVETIPPVNESGSVIVLAEPTALDTGPSTEQGSITVTSFLESHETALANEHSSLQSTSSLDGVESVQMKRTYTITGEGEHDTIQTLQPVFPDERALDVQWDFNVEHMGFASEWLAENSIINRDIRDGIGVVIGGDLSTTIDVILEYDTTGDGTADVTSDVQTLSNAYHTLSFEDNELFGDDGWYRVVVRGLRAGDTVNQLDIGALHANL